MAERLIVKQVGGIEVGVVTVDHLRRVRAASVRPDLASELDEVITRLASGRLTYITGDDILGPGGLVHQTRGRMVQPGDAGYLSALADAVTWSRETIGGARLRAWVTMDDSEDS